MTIESNVDTPKSLGDSRTRQERLARIADSPVSALTAFVHELRETMGSDYLVPYFDPSRSVPASFLETIPMSPQEFLLLSKGAGIDRKRTVIWNIVPWNIGSVKKICPANRHDLGDAKPALGQPLAALPALQSPIDPGQIAFGRQRAFQLKRGLGQR